MSLKKQELIAPKLHPKGSAKKVFNEFWELAKKDNCNRKTLSSISFDAGHELRHEQDDKINLKWNKTTSTFNYNGKQVTRTKLIVDTILGEIKVYEACSGKIFYHFLGNLKVKKNGLIQRTFEQVERLPAQTLEEAIKICEDKWCKVKGIINSI